MISGKQNFIGALLLIACAIGTPAFAQGEPGCIELKSTAQVQKEVVDAQGKKTVQMVPADKVVPGTEVTYLLMANNICKKATESVTFDNPVPVHMSYVANSATGDGSDITYSLDGKLFAKPAGLTVKENGTSRQARADEYKHVRWTFKDPLQPGATASASFRAVLN